MTYQRDAATRVLLNRISVEALLATPQSVLDGDMFYVKTNIAHGSIRLNIGGATVKIYEDGHVTTGADTSARTIFSNAKVV